MRNCQRNGKTFYYRLLTSSASAITDTDGNETGEYETTYADAVEARANISAARGVSALEQFGNLENYDKVIVTTDMTCPIDENTVLYIDTVPVKDETTGEYNAYDYVVSRVARSWNVISIAVRKVDVSV